MKKTDEMNDRIHHVMDLQGQRRRDEMADLHDAWADLKSEMWSQITTKGNWKFFAGIWTGFVIVWILSLLN